MSVTFKGTAVELEGNVVNVGQIAPVVELVAKDLSTISVGGASGKYQVLIVVPSLDTGVCATEARTFNQKVASKSNVEATVISLDLPFAMGRFCSTEGIENLRVASDFRGAKFGKEYGVLLASSPLAGLLTRAIFVLDPNGVVVYKELVSEITTEPNYDAALKAISGGGCGCGCSH